MRQTTQHRKVYETLRERIVKGLYPRSSKLPTEKELMGEFGLSRITIMRALSDLAHDQFIWRKQGAGSFVHGPPDSDFRLGIMIPGLIPSSRHDSVFHTLQHHLIRQASRMGWQVLLGDAEIPETVDPSGSVPVQVARRLVAHGVQAVVFTPLPVDARWNTLNRNTLAELNNANITVVLLGRDIVEYPERSDYDVVATDDIQSGYLLGRHLLAKGSRRVAFVSSRLRFPSPRLRLLGLRMALARSSLELTDEFVWQQGAANEQLVEEVVQRRGCDSIVCDNDADAALVMRNLLDAGLKIPQQVRLASFDDAPIAQLLPVPLTSVAQPAEALALETIAALRQRQDHPELPARFIQLSGRLIARTSTDE